MAMGFPIVLQVVGYQNSGKTIVITKLLEQLSKRGVKTGVLKHHGHNEKPALNDSGKDTESHRNAGAFITGISSSAGSVLSTEHELSLEKGIELYKILGIECILIEGYKMIQYPRVVLCRDKNDKKLIENSKDTIAVISIEHISPIQNTPNFLRDEEDQWVDYLMDYLSRRADEERAYHETL
jgi:molybdopterin-guanine dinucleotide biosynthesis adapter protein